MLRQILTLAAPTFVGQMAIMLNSVIDTVMAGQLSAVDQAGVGLGASIYISVYLAFTGVLMALSPIVAQHYGAKRLTEIGVDFRHAVMLALLLTIPAVPLLATTSFWFALASPPPEVESVTRGYLYAIAIGAPANLLFRTYTSLNQAISRPTMVMVINLMALGLKIPLNVLLIYGANLSIGGLTIHVPAFGGMGCAIATSIIYWVMFIVAYSLLRWLPIYQPFSLWGPWRLIPARLSALVKLGIPIGITFFIEITSFTFVAVFLARFGATVAASHQIAANVSAVAYMFPLALASAFSTLAAQGVGARNAQQAKQSLTYGMRLLATIAVLVSALIALLRGQIAHAYSGDPAVVSAATTLLLIIAIYHVFDAVQTGYTFGLRAFKVTQGPMWIYGICLWGLGLGLGAWIAFIAKPASLTPAQSFWVAAALAVMITTLALAWLSAKKVRAVIRKLGN